MVQVAIVYRGRQITLYRNGALYADYTIQGDACGLWPDDTVLVGRRHLRAAAPALFVGAVAEARIYDRA